MIRNYQKYIVFSNLALLSTRSGRERLDSSSRVAPLSKQQVTHVKWKAKNSPAILGCGAGISTKARRGWHTAAIAT